MMFSLTRSILNECVHICVFICIILSIKILCLLDNSIQGEEVVNSKFHMNIESLTLIMNKPEYELARATVSNLKANLSLHDGNTHVVGQLGSISVLDQSPYGLNFREKFISVGDQALTFDIFK